MFSGLTGWHVLFFLFMLVPLALWIVALVRIGMSKASGVLVALWIIIVTVIPLVGPILWFTIGERSVRRAPPTSAAASE